MSSSAMLSKISRACADRVGAGHLDENMPNRIIGGVLFEATLFGGGLKGNHKENPTFGVPLF